MNSKQKTKFKLNLKSSYFLAFMIPTLIMLGIFMLQEIYPFGERSFLHIDMYHQYFPFLVEFYHKIKNGESLFYSWNTGIGSNFLALYVYYLASPTNWLCLLFPEDLLMEFLSYMVIIKIGLCGLSFTYYIRKHFKTDSYAIVLFATFYALSGYMAAYNWNVMWLDCIVLAPVIILGLEQLVEKGTYKLYCLSLGLSILSNYYLSIMICIFLVLYFIVLLISKNPQTGNTSKPVAFPWLSKIENFYGKAILRFGVFSLLAGGMAAILLLPELAALRFTEFSSINFPSSVKTYFSTLDMLARHCFNVTVETGLDHWPNIYCGVAVFLLLPLYVMQKKVPVREKAPKLLLLAFILISFSTNLLNFIWHGLNYPDSLPARQSFLYIFLLLVLCYEAFLHIKEQAGNEIMGLFLGVSCFLLLCEKLITDDSFTSACFLFTGIFLIGYAGILYYYHSKQQVTRGIACFAVVLVILEAGANTYLTSVPTVSRTTYLSNYDSYQTLTERTMEQEGDFFRFDKFARRTQNDAMFIGFPSATYFSSTSNALVKDFYEKYGLKSSRVYYCFDGATPVTAALLANRYMLYTLDRGYDNMFTLADTEGKLYLYRNQYSLPLGFMISSDLVSSSDLNTITEHHYAFQNGVTSTTAAASTDLDADEALDDFFTDAQEVEENLHEDDTSDGLTPIQRQNHLVAQFGIEEPVFVPIDFEQASGSAFIQPDTSGHLYAYARNKKVDSITLKYGETSKTFKNINKKYILDLGYHESGESVSLSSENGEDLELMVYRIQEEPLAEFIDKLSAQTMTMDSYDDTHITGHITVENPGELVLSVAYEPGWTVLVDGEEANIDLFEDMMISVYLTEGEHTIELSYYPEGFNLGILVSLLSIACFALICFMAKRYKMPANAVTSKQKRMK